MLGPTRRREQVSLRLFVVPLVIIFIGLFALPVARSLYFSFTNFGGYSNKVSFVGLANYRALFSNPTVLTGLAFTLTYALGRALIVTVLAIPLAVVLNKRFVGRNFVRAAMFFPAVPSAAILGLVWAFILAPISMGVVNSALGALFGVGPVPWLSTNLLARLSVIMVGVWQQLGWHAMLYLAYLQSIPADYYDAADVDGASSVQRFFYITVPLLAPAMTISIVLLVVFGLQEYALPLALTGGGPGYATYTVSQTIITLGISNAQYGQGAALSILFLLMVAVVLVVQISILRRREARLR
jgi:multiple sugar transport system permease protein/raffinose/stachyose/melibiose transport system permease protein